MIEKSRPIKIASFGGRHSFIPKNKPNDSIQEYMSVTHKLAVGSSTAEKMKKEIRRTVDDRLPKWLHSKIVVLLVACTPIMELAQWQI